MDLKKTKEQTKIILDKFIKEGLSLNPKPILLVDYHHKLAQKPIQNHSNFNWPGIIRFSTVFDKREVKKAIKTEKVNQPLATIPTPLLNHQKLILPVINQPKLYYEQKKSLKSIFKNA